MRLCADRSKTRGENTTLPGFRRANVRRKRCTAAAGQGLNAHSHTGGGVELTNTSTGAELSIHGVPGARMAAAYRFAVGARVQCNVGEWEPGTVVALDYREEEWPRGDTAPYQVRVAL